MPDIIFTGDTPDDDVNKWGEATFKHMLSLLQSPASATAGMQLVDAYQLWNVSHLDSAQPPHHLRHLSHMCPAVECTVASVRAVYDVIYTC